jgi:rhodanese-related sulfurtransferase
MAEKITASDLKARKDEFVIIDAREADELANGKIEGSIHMPLGLTIRNVKKKQIFVLIAVLVTGETSLQMN